MKLAIYMMMTMCCTLQRGSALLVIS